MKTAQLKCSNCGAEISNLNMSWGKKQWLWFIPFMILVIVLPYYTTYRLRGGQHDFRSDLTIKETDKRYSNGTIEILGTIENHGKVNWEHIILKAELFGKDRKFLDILTYRIPDNLLPGANEHFKISKSEFPESRWEEIKDMKGKSSGCISFKILNL